MGTDDAAERYGTAVRDVDALIETPLTTLNSSRPGAHFTFRGRETTCVPDTWSWRNRPASRPARGLPHRPAPAAVTAMTSDSFAELGRALRKAAQGLMAP